MIKKKFGLDGKSAIFPKEKEKSVSITFDIADDDETRQFAPCL